MNENNYGELTIGGYNKNFLVHPFNYYPVNTN